MRSRTRPPHHAAVGTFRAIVDWLRAGYPDEAPTQGYSPLLALYGPVALSRSQTDRVLEDARGQSADPLAIDVAITKVTNRLPTPAQIAKIVRTLDESRSSVGPIR